eukprot:5947803-Prymnesium_polylepis.2
MAEGCALLVTAKSGVVRMSSMARFSARSAPRALQTQSLLPEQEPASGWLPIPAARIGRLVVLIEGAGCSFALVDRGDDLPTPVRAVGPVLVAKEVRVLIAHMHIFALDYPSGHITQTACSQQQVELRYHFGRGFAIDRPRPGDAGRGAATARVIATRPGLVTSPGAESTSASGQPVTHKAGDAVQEAEDCRRIGDLKLGREKVGINHRPESLILRLVEVEDAWALEYLLTYFLRHFGHIGLAPVERNVLHGTHNM